MDMAALPRVIETGNWPYGHCQGIAVDTQRGYCYCSFTTALIKLDLSGKVIGTVTGLLGHLGCIALGDDGRVYGSLEYKNDAIGQGILRQLGRTDTLSDAFYIAIFDADRIDRRDMDACADGVMKTVYLKKVCEDYAGHELRDGRTVPHRYGCSGIDGVTFARLAGEEEKTLFVSYGIYSDPMRTDNDYQVLLRYDTRNWETLAQPLSQEAMHQSGPEAPQDVFFVYTGNTTFGVQNLEYDGERMLMAVYGGQKPEFPNYELYAVDTAIPPQEACLLGREGERGQVLSLAARGEEKTPGWHYPHGSTGLCWIGAGYYYISQSLKAGDRHAARIRLCRWDGETPFAEVE